MKISTRGRYGLRALLDLALHQNERPILLKDIARRQEISLPYLEHIIISLIAVGIVKSTRGARGGVSLLKPPSEIKLLEVFHLLEGSISPVDCINNPNVCPRSSFCATRDVWGAVENAMSQVLESTTLQDLVERQIQKNKPETGMYHI